MGEMNRVERAEALRQGKRVFRARHIKTGAWWEGIAKDFYDALKKACVQIPYPMSEWEVREFTANGGWKKTERR